MTDTATDRTSANAPFQQIRQKRDESARRRIAAREERWREQRYAVPYRTDGPKVTLGVLWFAALMGAIQFRVSLLVPVVLVAAAIAGLQTAHAWDEYASVDRRASAALSALVVLGSVFGAFGLGAAAILSVIIAGIVVVATGVQHRDDIIDGMHLLVRSSVPTAIAAGSIVALAGVEPGAALALVVLVSAYESGDFLIGSGSANAVEGPVAGIFALAVVGSALFLVLPAPFTTNDYPIYAALLAIACPLGPMFGSAILPRGDAWSPGLRRLDSYLLAAPLWLMLIRPAAG